MGSTPSGLGVSSGKEAQNTTRYHSLVCSMDPRDGPSPDLSRLCLYPYHHLNTYPLALQGENPRESLLPLPSTTPSGPIPPWFSTSHGGSSRSPVDGHSLSCAPMEVWDPTL